jgi:predicted nucleic acid-binding protein
LKYILDTNVISELISKAPNKNVISFMNTIDESSIYLSVVTIGEINFGIHKLKSSTRKEKLLLWLNNDLLTRFENKIISLDTQTMLTWGKINNELKLLGNPMPIMDSLIAVTCIAKNMTLITRNEKDFVNLKLNVINPFL